MDLQYDGGDIVFLRVAFGKSFGFFEEKIQRFLRGFAPALLPDFGQPVPAEIPVVAIPEFVESIGGEQDGIAWRQLDRTWFVGRIREQSCRHPSLTQRTAARL